MFQRAWGHNDRPLLAEEVSFLILWPARQRKEVFRVPTQHRCKGACVSQMTAHPVTFEGSQKGEGCVQQAGSWNSSQQVEREKLRGKESVGKQGPWREGPWRDSKEWTMLFEFPTDRIPSREGSYPPPLSDPADDCCPTRWQDATNTFLVCCDFQSPSLGRPSPQHLIKGRKVIKEGHVTFPGTLN